MILSVITSIRVLLGSVIAERLYIHTYTYVHICIVQYIDVKQDSFKKHLKKKGPPESYYNHLLPDLTGCWSSSLCSLRSRLTTGIKTCLVISLLAKTAECLLRQINKKAKLLQGVGETGSKRSGGRLQQAWGRGRGGAPGSKSRWGRGAPIPTREGAGAGSKAGHCGKAGGGGYGSQVRVSRGRGNAFQNHEWGRPVINSSYFIIIFFGVRHLINYGNN